MKILVANWKMYMTPLLLDPWRKHHFSELNTLLKNTVRCVICPSYELLTLVSEHLKHNLVLGAQNCSNQLEGAFTGQVSSISLKELGCQYSIIGHSEVRNYLKENNEILGEKVKLLLLQQIIPVLCVGETWQEKKAARIEEILKKQINILNHLEIATFKPEIIIAYEPLWAIGSGNIPSEKELSESLNILEEALNPYRSAYNFSVLYGGSVNSATIALLKNPRLNGFLIGKASTDFQELKKIVVWLNTH